MLTYSAGTLACSLVVVAAMVLDEENKCKKS